MIRTFIAAPADEDTRAQLAAHGVKTNRIRK